MIDWTIVDEIRLFRWVSEFKPAGVNKHFNMLCIIERMNNPEEFPVTLLQKESVKADKLFTANDIWQKLDSYYNFETMDRLEKDSVSSEVPKDSNANELGLSVESKKALDRKREFGLPWDEYGDMIINNAKDGAAVSCHKDENIDNKELDKSSTAEETPNEELEKKVKDDAEETVEEQKNSDENSNDILDHDQEESNETFSSEREERPVIENAEKYETEDASKNVAVESDNETDDKEMEQTSVTELRSTRSLRTSRKSVTQKSDKETDDDADESNNSTKNIGKEYIENENIDIVEADENKFESKLAENKVKSDTEQNINEQKSTVVENVEVEEQKNEEGEDEEEGEYEESEPEEEGEVEEDVEEACEDVEKKEVSEADEDVKQPNEQPLAKRTRHSANVSQSSTTPDTSPKRRKKKTDQPITTRSSTRVSRRLRTRK